LKMWIGCAIAATIWGVVGAQLLSGHALAIWFEQTPLFLPAFALGISTAVHWYTDRTRPGANRLVWYGLVGYVALTPLASYVSRESGHVLTPLTMLGLGPLASIVVLGAARGGAPLLEHPIMRFLGGISFSLYLWHFVVIRIVPVPGAFADVFVMRAPCTTALSVPVATISFPCIERPFF